MRGVLSFALFLILVVIVPATFVSGIWEATRGRAIWPRLQDRAQVRLSGLSKLGISTAILCLPILAVPLAESQTGWIDEDGDGIMDGLRMADWFDINGWTLVALWVALAAPLLMGAALVGRGVDRRAAASASAT